MKYMLKSAKKKQVAKARGNSETMVVTPTNHLLSNYRALLPQLEPSRSKTTNVQQKSEARYIAKQSIRNAISHIMAVSVVHYQLSKPDSRVKDLTKLQLVLKSCAN